MTHRATRPTLFAALLLSLSASALVAQSPQEILARYNKAIDPTGKIATIQGMKSSITMDIPAAGMSATINAVQMRPNRMAMTIEIAGLGEMKQGYDGTTAWGSDPMQGPRIITGAEAATLIDGANFEAMARDPKLFTAMEAAGEGEVNGEKTVCVKLTWKSERVTTECYSAASGLLLETRSKQQSQMGEIEAVSRMSDYRDINGIMVPHKITQSAMGMEQVMTTTSVVFGPQDAKLFELPPEIKALKDK